MREVLQDRVFYSRSGGGLTISGGEPTAQIDFTAALLKSARKEGLHCCIETCGFSSWTNLERLLPLVDLFLYDYKESDPQRHLSYVGQSHEVISDNLKKLHDRGVAIQLQCPIVPGYNDREEHLQAIVATAKALPRLMGVALLPYHPLGTVKLQRLGLPDRANQLTATDTGKLLQQWTRILNVHGVRVMS
jgi:pyruvate formate lyase activating enzyme